MKLSDVIHEVAFKRLARSEIDPRVSRQKAIYGSAPIRKILGDVGEEKRRYSARVFYLDDDIESSVEADSIRITWGDRRANVASRAAEYRFYYGSGTDFERAAAGDALFIIRLVGIERDELLLAIAVQGASIEAQLMTLFGFGQEPDLHSDYRSSSDLEETEIGFAEANLLGLLGIEIGLVDPDKLDLMVERFPDGFPTTAVFSRFAREVSGCQARDGDPDEILIEWIQMEERLFRTFEQYLLLPKLDAVVDVESFLSLSLSVQNRRKSRAGRALENHLKQIFDDLQIKYCHNAVTENNKRPDFLFPGQEAYHDPAFPTDRLRLLGAKSTLKDRWRQVLSEGHRVWPKHLITLDVAISLNQMEEMRDNQLILVIPKPLKDTYQDACQHAILSLQEFIEDTRSTQYVV